MEGPVSFWGYKEQESNLILPEHDVDDDGKGRRIVLYKLTNILSLLKILDVELIQKVKLYFSYTQFYI